MEERHPKVRSTARAAGSLRHRKHSSSGQVSMAWQHSRATPSAPARESRTEETHLSYFPRRRSGVDTVGTAPLLHHLLEQSLATCAARRRHRVAQTLQSPSQEQLPAVNAAPIGTIVQLARELPFAEAPGAKDCRPTASFWR